MMFSSPVFMDVMNNDVKNYCCSLKQEKMLRLALGDLELSQESILDLKRDNRKLEQALKRSQESIMELQNVMWSTV